MLLKNNKGMALPLVLVIMMVLMILGTILMQYANQSVWQASVESKKMQAYYLAKSGVNLMIDQDLSTVLNPLPTTRDQAWTYDLASDTTNTNTTLTGLRNKGNFTLKIYSNVSGTKITIESTGKVGNIQETLIVDKYSDGKVNWRK